MKSTTSRSRLVTSPLPPLAESTSVEFTPPPWNSTCRGLHPTRNRPLFSRPSWNSTYREIPPAAESTTIPRLTEFTLPHALADTTLPLHHLQAFATADFNPPLVGFNPSSHLFYLRIRRASICQPSIQHFRTHSTRI